jgi:hypothetical protein
MTCDLRIDHTSTHVSPNCASLLMEPENKQNRVYRLGSYLTDMFCVSIAEINRLMLFSKIIVVYAENTTRQMNTPCLNITAAVHMVVTVN